ncbi:BEL1-like homeodomain protein 8 [Bidens hawaiensis]|uniref:BEL1-like homeodomain protein 8 n=1 Tax=Bidens hawaiensis TaxID=980011 RepID=UPI00404B283A
MNNMNNMNNIRTESHVAQKNRRHKLRFQHNSDDPTHQDPYRPVSYDPNVFPPEMLHSIANNPHLLLPPSHTFIDQDSGSVSVSGSSPASFALPATCKVIDQTQMQASNDHWNVVGSMNIDQTYAQTSGELAAFGCAPPPYYPNTLQEVVTSATVGSHNWMNGSDQLGFTQGLSLSLSSVPQAKPEFPTLNHCPKAGSDHPKQLMDMPSFAHRNVGPLGPFTGYATILKNSKYLKPAQELLSDSCKVGGQDLVQACDNTRKILEEEMSRVSGESGASSSTGYGSNDHVAGRSGSESYRPEFHHKKAKLLYMQEEVCRRYRQYHQQMQMVISSFETVAGLTSATPFVSLALKSVSRQFHFVKNAISEQLTQMKKTFEDLCSPSRIFDANNANDSLSQLKSMDHNLQRHGKSSGGMGSYANQQPIWRPQRGLPERAVAVLKAWLFDHFLHPYPSDADKHMLATQTGLTRNQVSNWFINARVRIWKPMVEEIHTLETKGLANSNSNNPPTDSQDTSHMDIGSLTNKQQAEGLRTSETLTMVNSQNEQLWDHEKRSRSDYHIPEPTMDRSFTNIMPYQRTTFEASGMGPVSLTLGLRQNAEHVQQLQQHEQQLRQRYGGQLVHDFVG